jgi:hypothetical protein
VGDESPNQTAVAVSDVFAVSYTQDVNDGREPADYEKMFCSLLASPWYRCG